MEKLQKLMDFYPKKYLISNYILSAIITISFISSLILEAAQSGESIGTIIIFSILMLISAVLYPFSKGLFFKPGASNVSKVAHSQGQKSPFITTLVVLYICFGFQLAFCYVLGFIFGPIKVVQITLSSENRCSWYDDYKYFSNFKNAIARKFGN